MWTPWGHRIAGAIKVYYTTLLPVFIGLPHAKQKRSWQEWYQWVTGNHRIPFAFPSVCTNLLLVTIHRGAPFLDRGHGGGQLETGKGQVVISKVVIDFVRPDVDTFLPVAHGARDC